MIIDPVAVVLSETNDTVLKRKSRLALQHNPATAADTQASQEPVHVQREPSAVVFVQELVVDDYTPLADSLPARCARNAGKKRNRKRKNQRTPATGPKIVACQNPSEHELLYCTTRLLLLRPRPHTLSSLNVKTLPPTKRSSIFLKTIESCGQILSPTGSLPGDRTAMISRLVHRMPT